ncbi:hypothetical protein CYMTET_3537 [Cymbomonas tetramitiformis]|uniref:AB hydrolase-1 domain-containing protein n=1 Tax=Cymbomonas tetramitiformis TaxID=36881 RepID=A0AAE0LL97_9CHLO|nr:hypothetical protein CYMTET_3537 [Cymbomonas tetramitiformis]
MSWASGMFEKPKRSSGRVRKTRDSGHGDRRHKDTLTEMRWHLDLPSDAESAFRASSQICSTEIPSLPCISKEELDEGKELSRAAEASVKGVHSLRFQDVSTGMRLRYLVWGESERVIILLHGIGESAGIFAGLGPRLASREYKVIALDLRGHGDSSSSQAGQYTPESLAQDLESFVIEKGVTLCKEH